ncbi:MAG: thermonuclease family protein [Alphaproteobacteria bacterium]|nr:thermonuclease family protein [Alphaproteobacteria bacterium]
MDTLDHQKGFRTNGPMRFLRLTYAPILAAMCLPLDANAALAQGPNGAIRFIPDCAGATEIARARVVRVEKNGALILSDGRAVLLEGIRLPQADNSPRFLLDQAMAALTQMTLAGPITFTAVAPKEDRYDRIRAQGFGRQWLQMALLEQGLARVAISPDRNECAPDLYEAEARVRAKHAGIWALAGAQPKAPQEMTAKAAPSGSFQLVDGWVITVGMGDGRVFINFGSNGRRSFTAIVAPEDRRAFRDFDFDALIATHIRIRGTVQDYRGRPQIALSNPQQIEVLQ